MLGDSLIDSMLSTRPIGILRLPRSGSGRLRCSRRRVATHRVAALLGDNRALGNGPVRPDSVNILTHTGGSLGQIRSRLMGLGIPALAADSIDVFRAVVTRSITTLLDTVLCPCHRSVVGQILADRLCNLDVGAVGTVVASRRSKVIRNDGATLDSSSGDFGSGGATTAGGGGDCRSFVACLGRKTRH